jgi:hypothetical protein
VLLLILAGLGVLVLKDEVDLFHMSTCRRLHCFWTDLVGGTALVGAKHDDVGRSVGELFGVERLVVLEEFHVCATTFKTILRRVSQSRTSTVPATYFEA